MVLFLKDGRNLCFVYLHFKTHIQAHFNIMITSKIRPIFSCYRLFSSNVISFRPLLLSQRWSFCWDYSWSIKNDHTISNI